MKIKAKLAGATFILLLTEVLKLHAQTGATGSSGECGDFSDPDNPSCPLDSWIYVLVFAALVFVSFHLYRRQKASSYRSNS
jgi:hypothetical protein